VEIDPAVTELAMKYFALKKNPRLSIYHEDARTFLKTTQKQYDAIFGDAFSAHAVPYHLTTREAVERMYQKLAPEGVVIVNLIASIEGDAGKFLRAEYRTYKSVFSNVYVFPVTDSKDGTQIQNIMLVAVKSEQPISLTSNDPELALYLGTRWSKNIPEDVPLLSDDFAPVEQYLLPIF
jgi:spermidine synthase